MLAYFGARDKLSKTFLGLFFISCPFVQLGRGIFFLDLLIVPFAFLGFEYLFKEDKRLMFFVVMTFMLVWFGHYYSFQAQNMAMERYINHLSINQLYDSFGIAPLSDINIPLLNCTI
jgi:hypothetical protein